MRAVTSRQRESIMAAMTGNFTSFHFSTERLPPRQRLPMWHEALDRAFGGRRIISPWSDELFHVEMSVQKLGCAGTDVDKQAGTCVIRLGATIHSSLRRIRAPLSEGNDDVILLIHKTGRRIVSQLGREAIV